MYTLLYKDWICITHTLDMYNIYIGHVWYVQLYIALHNVKKTRIITKLLHSYEWRKSEREVHQRVGRQRGGEETAEAVCRSHHLDPRWLPRTLQVRQRQRQRHTRRCKDTLDHLVSHLFIRYCLVFALFALAYPWILGVSVKKKFPFFFRTNVFLCIFES